MMEREYKTSTVFFRRDRWNHEVITSDFSENSVRVMERFRLAAMIRDCRQHETHAKKQELRLVVETEKKDAASLVFFESSSAIRLFSIIAANANLREKQTEFADIFADMVRSLFACSTRRYHSIQVLIQATLRKQPITNNSSCRPQNESFEGSVRSNEARTSILLLLN
mmetsp:Transcript_80137/g.214611  ORF Transcript_80137/g.214611 Transcript_80137/m.214611 type:complete len:168 (-) Transcript_80137:825-1328(-)